MLPTEQADVAGAASFPASGNGSSFTVKEESVDLSSSGAWQIAAEEGSCSIFLVQSPFMLKNA